MLTTRHINLPLYEAVTPIHCMLTVDWGEEKKSCRLIFLEGAGGSPDFEIHQLLQWSYYNDHFFFLPLAFALGQLVAPARNAEKKSRNSENFAKFRENSQESRPYARARYLADANFQYKKRVLQGGVRSSGHRKAQYNFPIFYRGPKIVDSN